MSDGQEIVVRPDALAGTALERVIGSGNVRESLAIMEQNVKDVIELCRDRQFVTKYDRKDKSGRVTGQADFYHLPAWQLLASTYGLVPYVVWSREIGSDGYEARAEVRIVANGQPVGAAEAMCTKRENGKKYASDHDLRAMAQSRAQRNALRSVLGAALVMAGFDFADPEAPATKDQVRAIWTLAGKQGYEHDTVHEMLGVESVKDLTREEAAEVIDRWSVLVDDEDAPVSGGEGTGPSRPAASSGSESDVSNGHVVGLGNPEVSDDTAGPLEGDGPAVEEDLDEPARVQDWASANTLGHSSAKVLKRINALRRDAGMEPLRAAHDITRKQLAAYMAEALHQ